MFSPCCWRWTPRKAEGQELVWQLQKIIQTVAEANLASPLRINRYRALPGYIKTDSKCTPPLPRSNPKPNSLEINSLMSTSDCYVFVLLVYTHSVLKWQIDKITSTHSKTDRDNLSHSQSARPYSCDLSALFQIPEIQSKERWFRVCF